MAKVSLNKLAGYSWVPRKTSDLEMGSRYIAIEEEFETQVGEFLVPKKGNVTIGKVIKVGSLGASRGIQEGDRVVYQKWQGGRWAFPTDTEDEQRCLIMDTNNVMIRIT